MEINMNKIGIAAIVCFFIACFDLSNHPNHPNAIELQIGLPSEFNSNDTTVDTGRTGQAEAVSVYNLGQNIGLCWKDSTKDTILFYFPVISTSKVTISVFKENYMGNYIPIDTICDNILLPAGKHFIEWKCDKSQDILMAVFHFEISLSFGIWFYTK